MTDDINSALGITAKSNVKDSDGEISKRYKEAYLLSGGIISYGGVLQTVGIMLGIICAIVGIVYGTGSPFIVLTGVLLGACVLLSFYFFGIIAKAMGQTLRAVLDTAVNSSPLFDNSQKKDALMQGTLITK